MAKPPKWRGVGQSKASAEEGCARRNLFGPINHELLQLQIRTEISSMNEHDRQKWNFDFQREVPLKGRYAWEEVSDGNSSSNGSNSQGGVGGREGAGASATGNSSRCDSHPGSSSSSTHAEGEALVHSHQQTLLTAASTIMDSNSMISNSESSLLSPPPSFEESEEPSSLRFLQLVKEYSEQRLLDPQQEGCVVAVVEPAAAIIQTVLQPIHVHRPIAATPPNLHRPHPWYQSQDKPGLSQLQCHTPTINPPRSPATDNNEQSPPLLTSIQYQNDENGENSINTITTTTNSSGLLLPQCVQSNHLIQLSQTYPQQPVSESLIPPGGGACRLDPVEVTPMPSSLTVPELVESPPPVTIVDGTKRRKSQVTDYFAQQKISRVQKPFDDQT